MQQTDKYKLNKPGVDDPITPVPLNENADKIEEALAALDGTAADLQGRVTVLEAKKMVVGSYTGTGSYGTGSQVIHLGFSPLALIVSSTTHTSMVLRDVKSSQLEITETGFVARNAAAIDFNNSPNIYRYIALV